MSSLQQFIFSGQAIRQEVRGEKQYISLTDCAKASGANRSKLSEILKSNRFEEYCGTFRTMTEKSDVIIIDDNYTIIDDLLLTITNTDKINYDLNVGTWLDIASEDGQDILLFIAQMLSPVFHRACNKFIRQFITEGYVISEKATSIQLASLQHELQKQTKLAKRHANQVIKLSSKQLALEESRTSITNEKELNNAMHLLFCKMGKSYFSEFTIPTGSSVIRLDSIRRAGKQLHIIEYKVDKIDYMVASQQLFGKKQYLAKLKNHFGNKPIRFTLASSLINEPELDQFVEDNEEIFGDNFMVDYCQLDKTYFSNLKAEYVQKLVNASGLTYRQAREAWKLADCDELVQAVLELSHES